jgi:predicted DNA-binding transcriptional regulator AlpA
MKLIRLHELIERLGLSRTTIWRLERSGRFPTRIRTSARLVAWLEEDVERWLAEQARGLSGATVIPREPSRHNAPPR